MKHKKRDLIFENILTFKSSKQDHVVVILKVSTTNKKLICCFRRPKKNKNKNIIDI